MHHRLGLTIALGSIALGCSRPSPAIEPSVTAQPASAPVRFAIAHDTAVRVMEVAPSGSVVEVRAVTVPAPVRALQWTGEEPVVMLGGARDGEVGRIAAAGYAALPAGSAIRPASPAYGLPAIAPSRSIQIELEEVTAPDDTDSTLTLLHCTRGGRTIDFPPGGGAGIDREITWLSTEPPSFLVYFPDHGPPPHMKPSNVVFEGCTPSKRDRDLTVEAGPRDTFALVGAHGASVRWRDREIAVLANVSYLKFQQLASAGAAPSRGSSARP